MPRASITIDLPASCDTVFAVIHDYSCRLDWDTMLRSARLLGGATQAGLGVRTVCAGTWRSAFLALETEYIQFAPGRAAAVKLTKRPWFFDRVAATMRHHAGGAACSRLVYTYSFRARPRWLAPVLEPLMHVLLQREVRQRLRGLRSYLERREQRS
jgi:hypothetical protein